MELRKRATINLERLLAQQLPASQKKTVTKEKEIVLKSRVVSKPNGLDDESKSPLPPLSTQELESPLIASQEKKLTDDFLYKSSVMLDWQPVVPVSIEDELELYSLQKQASVGDADPVGSKLEGDEKIKVRIDVALCTKIRICMF